MEVFMVQLGIYLREIIYFLRTTTLKNQYFADHALIHGVTDQYQEQLPVELNPYYRNLAGEYILLEESTLMNDQLIPNKKIYTRFNEMMYIISLDTLETIEFTKANLIAHPKTAVLYKIPSNYYFSLCNKYPDQHDLIKAIVYPIPSLIEATMAPNLSLLNYDATVLASNERDSLIGALISTLAYLRRRWDVKEYVYEELYSIEHQGIIWLILYLSLFVQRITNIRTNQTHPYHIWEYLQSKGLGDYRRILSIKQQLFLYRNINYLLKNKGTTNNLSLLIENLLTDYNIELRAKQIIQHTTELRESCTTTPAIVSSVAGSQVESDLQELIDGAQESLDSILLKAKENGLEPANEYLFAKSQLEQEKTFSRMPYTYLPTKLLELKRANESHRLSQIYAKFVAESILFRASENHLDFIVSFVPPDYPTPVSMPAKSALALLLYSVAKEQGMNYIKPPSIVQVEWPFKPIFPELPKTFKYRGTAYSVHHFLTPTGFSGMLEHQVPFATPNDMANVINDQAMCFLRQYLEWTKDAESKHTELLVKVYADRLYRGTIELNLLEDTTYDQWIKLDESLSSVINQIEHADDIKLAYANLSTAILDALYPYPSPYLEQSSTLDAARYTELRQLLVSLCSYNIAFLDTSGDTQQLTTTTGKTTLGSAGNFLQTNDYTLDMDSKIISKQRITNNFRTCLELALNSGVGSETTAHVEGWDIVHEAYISSELVQPLYVIEEHFHTEYITDIQP